MISPPLPPEDLDGVFRHLGPLWEEARGSRILITGASGFFGSWMVESLLYADSRLQLGATAVALTRSRERFRHKFPHLASDRRVEIVEADVCNMPMPSGPLKFVVHSLVPDAGFSLQQLERFFQSATLQLVEIAISKRVQAFLLCSTGAVYHSEHSLTALSEDDPLVPSNGPLSYGRIRRDVEDQCRTELSRTGVSLKIARGFAFVGPRLPLDANFAAGNFIRDAMAGGPIHVKGDGTPVRSYLYAADMAAWLWKILFSGKPESAYNVGSEQAITIRDLAHRVRQTLAPGAEVVIASDPMGDRSAHRYLPSCRKIRTELGCCETFSLDFALRRTSNWLAQTKKDTDLP